MVYIVYLEENILLKNANKLFYLMLKNTLVNGCDA